MNGSIAELMASKIDDDRKACKEIFGPGFQTGNQVIYFLEKNLIGKTVSNHLKSEPKSWTVESFQALYIACWIHHPLEKGTFMIPLENKYELNVYRTDTRDKVPTRISSHLSGKGQSAHRNWNFLNGYRELLIQFEDLSINKDSPHMMLKAEGHTTNLSQIPKHTLSYIAKIFSGAGRMASPALHNYAEKNYWMVELRAAENYAKGYESILKQLGLRRNMITVREFMKALFIKANWYPYCRWDDNKYKNESNQKLGHALRLYIASYRTTMLSTIKPNNTISQNVRSISPPYLMAVHDFKISNKSLFELEKLADSMIKDAEITTNRSYREVIASPQEIDKSVRIFKNINTDIIH